MKNMLTNFLKQLSGQDKSLPILGIFCVGIFIFSIAGNALYAILNMKEDINEWGILIGCLLAVILLFVLYIKFVAQKPYLKIDLSSDVPQKPFVISGLSYLNVPLNKEIEQNKVSNLRLILNLVEKHHPILKRLYLIESDKVQNSKEAFLDWYKTQNSFEVEFIRIQDGFNMDEIYQTITAYLQLLEQEGINLKNEVLLDITAGTAAISAGLTMSALANGCNLTYQATERTIGDNLQGTTRWQFFRNRIVQIWEIIPE